MKAKLLIFVITLGLCSNGLSAQETKTAQPNSKRFTLELKYGIGHSQPRTFMGENISDFGYSTPAPTGIGQFELDYALNERYSVVGGFAVQSLNLRYVFKDSEFRYSDNRFVIPIGMRVNVAAKNSPAKIIIGISGYYAFDSEAFLVSDESFGASTDVFNGFGVWSTIGFAYAITNEVGFNASFNALGELSANTIRTTSVFFSLGTYVKL